MISLKGLHLYVIHTKGIDYNLRTIQKYIKKLFLDIMFDRG